MPALLKTQYSELSPEEIKLIILLDDSLVSQPNNILFLQSLDLSKDFDIAAPNNTKKFSVKGSAPNSPRIPSVPKYFLDIIFSSDYLPDQKNLIL